MSLLTCSRCAYSVLLCCRDVWLQNKVNTLGLHQAVPPTVYRLDWLKEGTHIQVLYRALVFSNGTPSYYKICYDAAALNLCHILFGRSYQYDKGVTHNKRSNIHSLIFDNRHIALLLRLETPPALLVCVIVLCLDIEVTDSRNLVFFVLVLPSFLIFNT